MSDELTYEDVDQDQPQAREAGAVYETAADVVMSQKAVTSGNQAVERVAISPFGGAVLPANADTAARARAGKAAQRERLRQAALDGMLTRAQALRHGIITHEQAYSEIVADQTELALTPDAAGTTQAAAFVGKAIGATDADKHSSEPAPADSDLAQLLSVFRAWKAEHPEAAAQLGSGGSDGEQG